MHIEDHIINGQKVAEAVSDKLIIKSAADGLELLGNIYYQQYDYVILHEENITPDFFDLKTGLAGEILQKFTNYRVKLAIVGDFSKYKSNSLQQFIAESNKGRQVNFVPSIAEAFNWLAR